MVISKNIQTQGVNIKMKAYNTCSKVEIGISRINCGLQLTFGNDPQCKDDRCQNLMLKQHHPNLKSQVLNSTRE
jgi:hypothetical protein